MKIFRGFLLFPLLAAPLLVRFPIPEIPPWEMWFDPLGLYVGMAMLAATSLAVLLLLPCFVAGVLNRVRPGLGAPLMFVFSFVAIALFYAISPRGPAFDWIALTCILAALFSLLPYFAGFGVLALFRLAHRTKQA